MKTRHVKLILLSLALIFSFACQDKLVVTELENLKAEKAFEELNKSIVQRYWDGKWNERRPEVLDEFLTKDVKYHGSTEINGVDEYKQIYSAYLSACTDSKVEVENLIAEGEMVTSRIRLQGIHNGPLGDIQPTGNKIDFRATTVFRLVDGKIAEEWEILDELTMMTQLGLELK